MAMWECKRLPAAAAFFDFQRALHFRSLLIHIAAVFGEVLFFGSPRLYLSARFCFSRRKSRLGDVDFLPRHASRL